MQKLALTLDAALESDDEGPKSSSMHKKTLATEVPPTIEVLLNHLHLRAGIKQTAQKKARRTYAFGTDKLFIKAAEGALYYSLQIGYDEANGGLRDALIYFVETVLTNVAHRRTSKDFFESSIEKQLKASTFTDVFTNRSLP